MKCIIDNMESTRMNTAVTDREKIEVVQLCLTN